MHEQADSAGGGTHLERKLTPLHLLMMFWALIAFSGWLVGPFLAAGTARWWACWAYFGVVGAGLIALRRYVARRNPELQSRRKNVGEGTKRWDVVWNLAFWPLMALVPIMAGFGHRHGWTLMQLWLWPVGLVLLILAMAISARAMAVNPHFEGTVRIQKDRDHRVIDVGPYSRVRHPGYVGLGLWALASAFLLLSWAALIPAAVVVGWLLLRTALEDRLLRRELAGYSEYAARVRFRLVPGIW